MRTNVTPKEPVLWLERHAAHTTARFLTENMNSEPILLNSRRSFCFTTNFRTDTLELLHIRDHFLAVLSPPPLTTLVEL